MGVKSREILRWAVPPKASDPGQGNIDTVVYPTDDQILNIGIQESSANNYRGFINMFEEWLRLRGYLYPIAVKMLRLYLLWMVFLAYEGTYV